MIVSNTVPNRGRIAHVARIGDGAIDLLGEASDLRAVARKQRDGVPAVREAPGQRGTVAWPRSSHDGYGFAVLHRELLSRSMPEQIFGSVHTLTDK